jgi:ribosome-associated protein
MAQQVEIRDEYITLGQLLKLAGFIGSGGGAKDFLAEAQITVNGEPDNRRGRKVRPGDVVVVAGAGEIEVVGTGGDI